MAKNKFSTGNFFIRLVIAVILVFSSFNPMTPYSYFYWALSPLIADFSSFTALKAVVGMALLIGWCIYLRATIMSLGLFGTLLAVGFFSTLLWLIIEQGLVSVDSRETITWLVLIGLSGVLAAGISWSHIRRRMTGQLDVDENDGI